MSLRRVKPQLEDYDDGGVAISDLDSGEEEGAEGAESMDEDEDEDEDGQDGSGSGSSGEEEDEEVSIIDSSPQTPPSF